MKAAEHLSYFLSTTVKSMRSNLYLNIMTIVTIAVAFLILNIFFVIYGNVDSMLGAWRGRIKIIAYLRDDVSGTRLSAIEAKIRTNDDVKDVTYYSSREALNRFRLELKGQAGILSGVSANVLPAYLVVTVKDAAIDTNAVKSIAAFIKGIPDVNDVQYGEQITEKISGILLLARMLGIGIGGFMLFAIFIIVSNTIRISIFSRKDEIEIMKLVGATNTFIEVPFMLEGLIQVLAGTVVSIALLYFVYRVFLYQVHTAFNVTLVTIRISFLPVSTIIGILLGSALLGIAVAVVSTRKFIGSSY